MNRMKGNTSPLVYDESSCFEKFVSGTVSQFENFAGHQAVLCLCQCYIRSTHINRDGNPCEYQLFKFVQNTKYKYLKLASNA